MQQVVVRPSCNNKGCLTGITLSLFLARRVVLLCRNTCMFDAQLRVQLLNTHHLRKGSWSLPCMHPPCKPCTPFLDHLCRAYLLNC